ncbi:hypothetical protein, partial [Pseudomonas sp.]|uniref:hypothetical protein n=1 Tax=Pseudomonas sp. TaxID=306 RepID=UPI0025841BA9
PEKVAEHYDPPITLKDWAIPKARYATAEEWMTAKPEADGESPATARDEAPASDAAPKDDQVRQPTGGVAQSLRDELLEGYKA